MWAWLRMIGVDPAGVERELGVQLAGFGPPALEQAGVEEDPGAGGLDQVHRAGDLAGGAPESDPHGQRGPEEPVAGVAQPGQDVALAH